MDTGLHGGHDDDDDGQKLATVGMWPVWGQLMIHALPGYVCTSSHVMLLALDLPQLPSSVFMRVGLPDLF